MVVPRRVQFLAGLLILAGSLSVVSFSAAQDGQKGEKIRFTTVDGVEIQGMFYAGASRKSPTIMFLHALGEDSRKKAWVSLAESLNKAGYAVLTFDFRGHGQSTSIEPTVFWNSKNAALVKGAPKKESIEFKDMKSEYYPVLVNDIAAAKAFLDQRNDNGECNTSSFMVLGAETGATLGALWLNAEWHRFRFDPAVFMVSPAMIAKTSEGRDTIAAIWLSATTKLGSRTVYLTKLLAVAGKENATPMVFMCSDEDTFSKSIAVACEKALKGGKKDEKYRFTAAVPIKGGGKLKGAGLLQKSLGTDDAIVEYIKGVVEAKSNEWSEREFRRNQYVWKLADQAPVPAKLPKEKTLIFDTYERFLPR